MRCAQTSQRSVQTSSMFSHTASSLRRDFTLCSPAQLQMIKCQAQPQTSYVSEISLFKATCVNIGLNPLKVTTFIPSDINPHISHL